MKLGLVSAVILGLSVCAWSQSGSGGLPQTAVEAKILAARDGTTEGSERQSADLLVTSSLMGYYRLPDRQPFKVNEAGVKCVAEDGSKPETKPSPDAQIFLREFANPDEVRVGTGDNFAPNYYARVFKDPPPGRAAEPGKELYEWDWDPSHKAWRWYEERFARQDALHKGRGTIPTDNVACFLARAHYDAIVPGKHDFYYGPERLRELARFLASVDADKDNKFQPVQMLAANMVIKTSWAKPKDHAPVPDSSKPPLGFATADPGHKLEISNISDGDAVYPWIRFVRITAKASAGSFKIYLCRAAAANPDEFLNQLSGDCAHGLDLGDKDQKASDEAALSARRSEPDEVSIRQLVYRLPDPQGENGLRPGQNYAICIHPNSQGTKPGLPYCIRFSVYTPFLQYPDWPSSGNSDASAGEIYRNPRLYSLKYDQDGSGKTPVVIFGVVDPQLLEQIGGDNYAWETIRDASQAIPAWDQRYSTRVTAEDPLHALIQLQDYFEEQYSLGHNGKTFRGVRVLLAQMPPDHARQLADHLPPCLRFNVIVTAAYDALATPNQALDIHPAQAEKDQPCPGDVGASVSKRGQDKDGNGVLATPGTFVLVPPSHLITPDKRKLQARKLKVLTDGDGHSYYALSGDPAPVGRTEPKKFPAIDSFWVQVCHVLFPSPHWPNPGAVNCSEYAEKMDKKQAIQEVALWSMRKKWAADVALLQERDFYRSGVEDYFAEHCQSPGDTSPDHQLRCDDADVKVDIQEILDRVIWKGDNLQVLSVTGAALKSVLKDSDEYGKNEKTAYLPVSEAGRALVKLGLRADPGSSGSFLINDKPLDPAALYTVATSDFIGLGDTGYPELATPPVGRTTPPASPQGELVPISGIACAEFIGYECRKKLGRKDYFDETTLAASDPREGNTNRHKFYAWSFLGKLRLGQPGPGRGQAGLGPESISAAKQKQLEAQPNWEWSFDKLGIGFSGLLHSNSEQTVSNQFGGVLNSTVTAARFHQWDWDVSDKVVWFHPRIDWFLGDTLQYSSLLTAQTSGPATETQPHNLFTGDGGAYVHLGRSWRNKGLPQLALAVYGHLLGQVGDPITSVNLDAIGSAPASVLTFHQGRTVLALGRTGLRWQDRKSYVEAGLEGGQTLNAIRQFNVVGTSLHCPLEASVSLTMCLNNFNLAQGGPAITAGSVITTTKGRQDRYGAYWNMGITVPIRPAISYKLQETSDYFFLSGGDNSADTRFMHTLVSSLRFSILQNLSFEPTYTLFLFENKVDYNFLVQQQYAIKINYSFHFSNPHEGGRQFGYKKPASE